VFEAMSSGGKFMSDVEPGMQTYSWIECYASDSLPQIEEEYQYACGNKI